MKFRQVVFLLISAHKVASVVQLLAMIKPFLFDYKVIISVEEVSFR